jgi:uncharacterized protein (TIRG00374 family)
LSTAGRSQWASVLRWLQPLLGALILGVVAWSLPWGDQLALESGARTAVVPGEIEGDWRSDRASFAVDSAAPDTLPEELAGELRLELERLADGTWQWRGRPVELRPGLPRVFAGVEQSGLAVAMGFFLLALACGVTRWWRLLLLSGCAVRWWDSFRLTFLGLFFNLVVPGLTGGDVIKAILAAKENPGRRADALVSVVVDRILGLGTLAALATVVILVLGGPFAELRVPVAIVLVVLVGGALVYVNQWARRLLRYEALLARLPFAAKLAEVDAAIVRYTRHPGEMVLALALSLGNHGGAILGVMSLSMAFGVGLEAVGLGDYMALVPVANMISSVPIAPGGWGVGEAAYGYLYTLLGQPAAIGFAVSVTFRLCQVLLGLLGGLYLLRPGAQAELQRAEVQAESL